jgi:hypothetical protein
MFLTNSGPNVGIVVPIDDQTWLQGAIKASVWVIFQRSSAELLIVIN